MSGRVWELDGRLLDVLHELDTSFERVEAGAYVVHEESSGALLQLAYGDRLAADPALAAKVLADGAGRRPAGTPDQAPRRDVRR